MHIDYDKTTNMITLRWTAEEGRVYKIEGTSDLVTWPDDLDDSFNPGSVDAVFPPFLRPTAPTYAFRIRDVGPAPAPPN